MNKKIMALIACVSIVGVGSYMYGATFGYVQGKLKGALMDYKKDDKKENKEALQIAYDAYITFPNRRAAQESALNALAKNYSAQLEKLDNYPLPEKVESTKKKTKIKEDNDDKSKGKTWKDVMGTADEPAWNKMDFSKVITKDLNAALQLDGDNTFGKVLSDYLGEDKKDKKLAPFFLAKAQQIQDRKNELEDADTFKDLYDGIVELNK